MRSISTISNTNLFGTRLAMLRSGFATNKPKRITLNTSGWIRLASIKQIRNELSEMITSMFR